MRGHTSNAAAALGERTDFRMNIRESRVYPRMQMGKSRSPRHRLRLARRGGLRAPLPASDHCHPVLHFKHARKPFGGPWKTALLLSLVFVMAANANPHPEELRDGIDWRVFLAAQDPVWERMPTVWNDGAFLGNGQLGDMVYADSRGNGLVIHVGRSDVTDHRNEPKNLPPNLKGKRPDSQVWGSGHTETYRIDIGDLVLHPAGDIKSGTMRLDLWNAEVRGEMTTTLGKIEWKSYVHADRMLTICEVVSTEKTPDGKPARWRWEFIPSPASSGRWLLNPTDKMFAKGYAPNPDPVLGSEGDVHTSTETLPAGGDFATAWKESRTLPRTASSMRP